MSAGAPPLPIGLEDLGELTVDYRPTESLPMAVRLGLEYERRGLQAPEMPARLVAEYRRRGMIGGYRSPTGFDVSVPEQQARALERYSQIKGQFQPQGEDERLNFIRQRRNEWLDQTEALEQRRLMNLQEPGSGRGFVGRAAEAMGGAGAPEFDLSAADVKRITGRPAGPSVLSDAEQARLRREIDPGQQLNALQRQDLFRRMVDSGALERKEQEWGQEFDAGNTPYAAFVRTRKALGDQLIEEYFEENPGADPNSSEAQLLAQRHAQYELARAGFTPSNAGQLEAIVNQDYLDRETERMKKIGGPVADRLPDLLGVPVSYGAGLVTTLTTDLMGSSASFATGLGAQALEAMTGSDFGLRDMTLGIQEFWLNRVARGPLGASREKGASGELKRLSYNLGKGTGTLVQAIALANAGGAFAKARGLSARYQIVAAKMAGLGYATALEGGMQQHQVYQSLIAKGYSIEEAQDWAAASGAAVGIINGLLEMAPIEHFLFRNPAAGGRFAAGIRGGLVEGSTEGLQTIVSIIGESAVTGDTVVNWQNVAEVLESALVGGMVGGGAGVAIGPGGLAGDVAQQAEQERIDALRDAIIDQQRRQQQRMEAGTIAPPVDDKTPSPTTEAPPVEPTPEDATPPRARHPKVLVTPKHVGQWYGKTFGDTEGAAAIEALASMSSERFVQADVPLDAVDATTLGDTKPINQENVAEISHLNAEEIAGLPPAIIVPQTSGSLSIADGTHRLLGLRQNPAATTIRAYVPESVAKSLEAPAPAPPTAPPPPTPTTEAPPAGPGPGAAPAAIERPKGPADVATVSADEWAQGGWDRTESPPIKDIETAQRFAFGLVDVTTEARDYALVTRGDGTYLVISRPTPAEAAPPAPTEAPPTETPPPKPKRPSQWERAAEQGKETAAVVERSQELVRELQELGAIAGEIGRLGEVTPEIQERLARFAEEGEVPPSGRRPLPAEALRVEEARAEIPTLFERAAALVKRGAAWPRSLERRLRIRIRGEKAWSDQQRDQFREQIATQRETVQAGGIPGQVFKHFTTPESAAALRAGGTFDPTRPAAHPIMEGKGEEVAEGKRFAGPRLYLSLDDQRWGSRTETDQSIEAIPSRELGRDAGDSDALFYDYGKQEWMVRPGAQQIVGLEPVEYRISPDAKILTIGHPDALRQTLAEVDVEFFNTEGREGPLMWEKLAAAGYDAVAIVNTKEHVNAHKFFKAAGGDTLVVLNQDAVELVRGVGAAGPQVAIAGLEGEVSVQEEADRIVRQFVEITDDEGSPEEIDRRWRQFIRQARGRARKAGRTLADSNVYREIELTSEHKAAVTDVVDELMDDLVDIDMPFVTDEVALSDLLMPMLSSWVTETAPMPTVAPPAPTAPRPEAPPVAPEVAPPPTEAPPTPPPTETTSIDDLAKNMKTSAATLRKRAAKMREAADRLDKKIEERRRPMTQNPTPKRMREYRSRLREGDRIEQRQTVLRALADHIEAGTLPEVAWKITAGTHVDYFLDRQPSDLTQPGEDLRAQWGWHQNDVRSLGITKPSQFEEAREFIRGLIAPETEEQRKANALAKAEADLVGTKLPGYFPTPAPVVERIVDAAQIEPGLRVLEPSAGKGDLAQAAVDAGAGSVEVVETSQQLGEILTLRGFATPPGTPLGTSFLEADPDPGHQYDVIVMNPPFEKGQDQQHVRHAHEFLAPGGRLVAVMSEGTFYREDKKSKSFRVWLAAAGGTSEQLPAGSFTGAQAARQTGTAMRLVVIDAPGKRKEAARGPQETAPTEERPPTEEGPPPRPEGGPAGRPGPPEAPPTEPEGVEPVEPPAKAGTAVLSRVWVRPNEQGDVEVIDAITYAAAEGREKLDVEGASTLADVADGITDQDEIRALIVRADDRPSYLPPIHEDDQAALRRLLDRYTPEPLAYLDDEGEPAGPIAELDPEDDDARQKILNAYGKADPSLPLLPMDRELIQRAKEIQAVKWREGRGFEHVKDTADEQLWIESEEYIRENYRPGKPQQDRLKNRARILREWESTRRLTKVPGKTRKPSKGPGVAKASRPPAVQTVAQVRKLADGFTARDPGRYTGMAGIYIRADGQRIVASDGRSLIEITDTEASYGPEGPHTVTSKGGLSKMEEAEVPPQFAEDDKQFREWLDTIDAGAIDFDQLNRMLSAVRQLGSLRDAEPVTVVIMRNPDGSFGLHGSVPEAGAGEWNVQEGAETVAAFGDGYLEEALEAHYANRPPTTILVGFPRAGTKDKPGDRMLTLSSINGTRTVRTLLVGVRMDRGDATIRTREPIAEPEPETPAEAEAVPAPEGVVTEPITFEAYRTTGVEFGYGAIGPQRSAGIYLSLDEPFRQGGANEVVHRARVTIAPAKIMDPNGVIPGTDVEKSRRDYERSADVMNERYEAAAESGETPPAGAEMSRQVLQEMGYEAEAGYIDRAGGARELVVFDEGLVGLRDVTAEIPETMTERGPGPSEPGAAPPGEGPGPGAAGMPIAPPPKDPGDPAPGFDPDTGETVLEAPTGPRRIEGVAERKAARPGAPVPVAGAYTADVNPLTDKPGAFRRRPEDKPSRIAKHTEAVQRATRDGERAAKDDIYRIISDMARRFAVGRPGIARRRILNKHAAGIYQVLPPTQEIRLRRGSYVSTFFHELGHHLHEIMFPRGTRPDQADLTKTRRMSKKAGAYDFPNEWRKELVLLGKDLYGDKDPVGGYASEGWAETIRFLLVNPKHLKARAPTVYQQVTAHLVREHPDVWIALLNGRARFYNALMAAREDPVDQFVAHDDRRTWSLRSLYDSWRIGWMDRMQRAHTFKQDLNLDDLRADMDPHTLALRAYGRISGEVKLMTERHRFHPSRPHERTGESLREILEPVKNHLRKWQNYMVARRALEKRAQGYSEVLVQDPRLPRQTTMRELEGFVRNLEDSHPEWGDYFKRRGATDSRVTTDEEGNQVIEKIPVEEPSTVAARFQQFNRWLVTQYAVYHGLLTPEVAARIVAKNLDYITFRHKKTEDAIARRVGAMRAQKFSGMTSGFSRFREGYGEQLFPPLESFAVSLQGIVSRANLNRVMQSFYWIYRSDTAGAGRWFSQRSRPMDAMTVAGAQISEEVQKQLGFRIIEAGGGKALLMDKDSPLAGLEEEQALEIAIAVDSLQKATFWKPGNRTDRDNREITILVGGKPVFLEVQDDRLFDMLEGLNNPYIAGTVMKWLGMPARILRAGATQKNPSFFLPNFTRDMMQALTMTQAELGNLPVDIRRRLRGMRAAFMGGDIYQMFLASGADMSGLFGEFYNPVSKQVDIRKLFATPKLFGLSKGFGVKDRVVDLLKLGPIDRMNQAMELANRMAEFEAVRAGRTDPGSIAEAGQAAADITLDFQRGGAYAKQINQMVPFFNAAILGTDKLGRFIKKSPMWAFGAIFATQVVPTLIEFALNYDDEDYWAQPWDVRDRYWHIPTGYDDTGRRTWLKIARPYGLGLFAVATARSLAAAFGINPENPEGPRGDPRALGTEAIAAIVRELRPTISLAGIQPILEVMYSDQGFSFYRQREVVSTADKDLPLGMQGATRSSDLARVLGDFMGYPPAKIDHLINGFFGGLGRDVTSTVVDPMIRAVDPRAKEGEPIEFSDWLVVRRFVARASRSQHEALRRFFDDYQQLKRVTRGLKVLEDQPERAAEYEDRHVAALDAWPDFTRAYRAMSEHFQELRRLYRTRDLPADELDSEITRIYDAIIEIAREPLRMRSEAEQQE